MRFKFSFLILLFFLFSFLKSELFFPDAFYKEKIQDFCSDFGINNSDKSKKDAMEGFVRQLKEEGITSVSRFFHRAKIIQKHPTLTNLSVLFNGFTFTHLNAFEKYILNIAPNGRIYIAYLNLCQEIFNYGLVCQVKCRCVCGWNYCKKEVEMSVYRLVYCEIFKKEVSEWLITNGKNLHSEKKEEAMKCHEIFLQVLQEMSGLL